MYEYDEDDEPRHLGRLGLAAFALALGIGWFLVRPALRSDEGSGSPVPLVFDRVSSESTAGVDSIVPTAVAPESDPPTVPNGTIGRPSTSSSTVATALTTSSPTSTDPVEPTPTVTTTTTTTTSTTTTSLASTTTLPTLAVAHAQPETTLPDGRPVAGTMTFTTDQITLTGAVPTQAARVRLVMIASGFSLTSSVITDNLTVDPAAPVDAGILIVEHNSINFVGDTDTITPAHAEQLDRLVLFMSAFPDVRLHVVGNTDQQGREARNFVISQRRAAAIVNYLVAHGVDSGRLTTQPAGESNPITTEAGPAADALNRRTDFVIFGLLD